MPAYKTGKKTAQYSLDFKLKAVEWSYETHRTVKSVAEALDIHTLMLVRWSFLDLIRKGNGLRLFL
ncbi:transposase [Salinivibrio costicola]|uniref:Transposase n=1 Tax=Salinivibrio costicola TaxID=51367 RepID=A0ABX6K825_SALCS|nr:transposase [Salinivibrio costicola]QIR07672.1 transposase [Salinivibrio costicola]